MALFFDNMKVAAVQVLTLFILVAVGFIADRLKFFTAATAKATTNLVFYVVTPTVIVRSFVSMDYSKENLVGFLTALGCGMCVFILGIVLSSPLFRKCPDSVKSVYKFASTYGNMGYMCLPLAASVLGDEGVFYCSAAVVAYQLFSFTHGIWLMSRGREGYKFKPKSLVLNPGVIAVIIGLPLFIFSVKLPGVLDKSTVHIANLNSPLAMIILGTYISNSDIKTLFKQKEHYIIMLVRQICVPLILISVYKLCGMNGVLLTACGISASAPSAANTVIFAAKYDRDTAAASKAVAFSTFMSVFTMPVMIALTQI